MRALRCTVIVLALAFLPVQTFSASADYSVERRLFLQAEKSLRAGKITQFKAQAKNLRHYPLYPYLEYESFMRYLPQLPLKEVERFASDYPDSSLSPRLYQSWLLSRAKHNRWQDYLQGYQQYQGPQTSELKCNEVLAKYHTSHNESVLAEAKAFWLTGESQPKACEQLFTLWEKEGGLTQALIWDRIELGIKKKNHSLVKHLGTYIPRSEQPALTLWEQLRQHPERVTGSPSLKSEHPLLRRILANGISYLSQKSTPEAIEAWHKINARYTFTEYEKSIAFTDIAISLARQHHPDALQWLKQIPDQFSSELVQAWRIRTALAQNNWETVKTYIDRLPDSMKEESRWQYWRARALSEIGEPDESTRIFQTLSAERGYYGFLASTRLGVPYTLKNETLQLSSQLSIAVSNKSCIHRTLELMALGRESDAKREWIAGVKKMTDEEIVASARIADKYGWHHFAIIAMAKATNYKDDMPLRFPLANSQHVLTAAKKQKIEPAWVFAITRQESAFATSAKSSVGALGLMQLMPATAHQVARQNKVPYKNKNDLLGTDLNIKLGAGYLKHLLETHQGSMVLATAAYNAGPSRVKLWLNNRSTLEADQWIETIPFAETRDYVQNVMTYLGIYRQRLGEHGTLEALTAPIKKSS